MEGTAAVTGANGFVGSNLCDELVTRGWKVRAIVRPSSSLRWLNQDKVEVWKTQLSTSDEMSKAVQYVDVVFHCAAQTQATSIKQLMASNRDTTRDLIQTISQSAKPPRLVLVSSVAASGPGKRGMYRLPSDPCRPISHYGFSKRAAEIVATEMCDRVPVVIVRPGPVYGERDMEFLQLFKTLQLLRLNPIPGYFSPFLSMIHVKDLVDILIRAAEKGSTVEGEPETTGGKGFYFAADREPTTLASFGSRCAKSLGLKLMVNLPVPIFIADGIAVANECYMKLTGKKTNLTRDKIREAAAPSWVVSPQSTFRDLGCTLEIPMQERIHQTMHWYRAQGLL